jgi:Ca2+-binding EF-hand superfamily protein
MTVMVDKIFAMVDVDGSGDISSEELFTFLKNLGMGAGGISDVEKIIDQIDEDGDNSIDKKELKKFLIKNMAN